MEALIRDRTSQASVAKHPVHPNQLSGWQRQAVDGLWELLPRRVRRSALYHELGAYAMHRPTVPVVFVLPQRRMARYPAV